MRLYHRTQQGAAIMRSGFRDGEGSYGFATLRLRGVFLSDVPLDLNEGASGDDLLEVVMDAELLVDYELIQNSSPYREWCVPADLVNHHASIRLLPSDD